jgi:hypothetical protein
MPTDVAGSRLTATDGNVSAASVVVLGKLGLGFRDMPHHCGTTRTYARGRTSREWKYRLPILAYCVGWYSGGTPATFRETGRGNFVEFPVLFTLGRGVALGWRQSSGPASMPVP